MASLRRVLAAIKERETPNLKSSDVARRLEAYHNSLRLYECFPRLEDEDSSSDDEVSETEVGPPSGPAQVSTTRRFRTFIDVPLDVFHEIVSYLAVADLLSVSKTCKPFCQMLMSVSSKTLWKTALDRIEGLPPCPDILSERFVMSAKAKYLTAMELRQAYTGKWTFDPRTNSVVIVLKRDVNTLVDEIKSAGVPISSLGIEKWREHKIKAINARRQFISELIKYIGKTESDWYSEAFKIKRTREREIKERLLKDGWTSCDMEFKFRKTLNSWDQLIGRPKLLTVAAWRKLYPELVSLLKANREDMKNSRSRDLIKILKKDIYPKDESQLLVSVIVHGSYSQRNYAETRHRLIYYPFKWDFWKVYMPFPSPAEALTIPVIKEQIEEDISDEERRQNLINLKKEVGQALVDWRTKIRQDFFKIWNEEREEFPIDLEATTSHALGISDLTSGSSNQGNLSSPVLPKFTLKFTRQGGETTQDIRELPEDLQLLLRADVFFKSFQEDDPCMCRHTYLGIASQSDSCHSCEDQWDSKTLKHDHEASAVARALLKWIGRPNATSAEMRALGATFQCGRCHHINTWEGLIHHYVTEISRWRIGKQKLEERDSPHPIFNHTHTLDLTNGAFFQFVPPSKDPDRLDQSLQSALCKICQELGIHVLCQWDSDHELSEISEHIRNVHNIRYPILGDHFEDPKDCRIFSEFGDTDESECEDDGY
ncbi:DNA mismatch repair protein MutS [Ceratobasidium theobromae]|uniref:DNA mismatch repair protein MutS n=1 Tax=Ceratobasidium theobromae TaxID=1582974 RepID=A0A5N5QCP4_9AGAM|nr:DNA mismatch repair protein MutS [Ceratobasidium theobromae]